jgi:hypothetical protein
MLKSGTGQILDMISHFRSLVASLRKDTVIQSHLRRAEVYNSTRTNGSESRYAVLN